MKIELKANLILTIPDSGITKEDAPEIALFVEQKINEMMLLPWKGETSKIGIRIHTRLYKIT